MSSDSSGTITSWAAWSPAGERLVYARGGAEGSRGWVHRLETCDLQGNRRFLIADTPEQSMHYYTLPLWLRDGRVLFGLTDPPPNQAEMNLWSLGVDPRSGVPSGKPRRVTQWQRVSLIEPLGASKDGRRLSVGVMKYQSDCYVGRVAGADSMLQDVTRLTVDDRMDIEPAWTPDSRGIVFTSERNSNEDVFEQALGSTDAQPLVTGPGDQYAPQLSADGAWLLYKHLSTERDQDASIRIMRLPLGGGPAEVVMDAQPVALYRRAARADSVWVLSEVEQGRTVFWRFDPSTGRGGELGSLNVRPLSRWDLSPDGLRVAVVQLEDSTPRIQVLSFSDHATSEVRLDRQVQLDDIRWAPDNSSWYVVSAGEGYAWTVLRVMPNGRTIPLLPPQTWMYTCAPSPDGRHLVYTSNTGDESLWLLEDF